MMKQFYLLFFICCLALNSHAQKVTYTTFTTPFERSNGKESATYDEVIDFYDSLDKKYDRIKMLNIGTSDTKYSMNIVIYSKDQGFTIKQWKEEGKMIIFINNGIHAGEPDGIDASMMLLRDAASGKINVPDNVVLCVVPMSNIGGSLNRNSTARANQNGPKEYGTRTGFQHLDFNRDFIKLDSRDMRSVVNFFYQVEPDIFLDTHVSDGADYQHIMTLLATQHDKLGGETGKYMYENFVPEIYKDMKTRGYDLVPYVNQFNNTPDSGWTEFYDPARFSSGYAALFHAMAFVSETHMLKPFDQRVKATYELMLSLIKLGSKNADAIHKARNADFNVVKPGNDFILDWKLDSTKKDMIEFKGYAAGYKPSLVSGQPRLYYDHNKPYTRKVPFYDHYKPTLSIKAPKGYAVRACWPDALARMNLNGAKFTKLKNDTTLDVVAYYIDDYETVPYPYEKHYLHKNVHVHTEKQTIQLMAGDFLGDIDTHSGGFMMSVLEPQSPEGYFAWGFFDGVLQQKEFYSDYVFEDEAPKILEKDSGLKKMLEDKKKADPAFAKDGKAQLDFVYRHSPHFETTANMYPIYRLE